MVRQAEGLADWVGSVALFYKSEELQAQLQYQYTGKQIAWYSTESSDYFAGNKIAPQSKLDFSARYKLTEKWFLNIAISNILGFETCFRRDDLSHFSNFVAVIA